MVVRMHPWAPLAKELDIPLTSDWVVTMVTPVDKVLKMYKEDVLKAYDNQTNRLDEPIKTGLTD